MKALVYYGNKDLRLENKPEPSTAKGDIKLKIDYCGICATDIEEYSNGPLFIRHESPHPLTGKKIPLITGHEIIGTIIECGVGVESAKVGDRVVLDGILSCNECWWCKKGEPTQCPSMAVVGFDRDGGLAEFMTWPAAKTINIPQNVSSTEAALCEPTAVAYHAVQRAEPKPGQSVAIIGVGTVGLLALQIIKSTGTKVHAVDQREKSLDLAKTLGADSVINPEHSDPVQAIRDLTGGIGADIVIEAAGAPGTPELSMKMVRTGGKVVIVAIFDSKPPFDFNSIVSREIQVLGSLAYTRDDMENAVRLIANKDVRTKPLVSDVIKLTEVMDSGFQRMLQKNKDVFRIIVDPSK